MIILGTLSLALVSRHIQQTVYDALNSTKPEEARAAKLWLIGAAALLLTVIATIVGINWAMNASFAQGAEPFVWLEGVSVWPSLVLRFARLDNHDCPRDRVQNLDAPAGTAHLRALRLADATDMEARAQSVVRGFGTARISTSLHSARQGNLSPKRAGAPVEIASLWQNYLRATGWREMWAWIMTSTVIVFLLGVRAVLSFRQTVVSASRPVRRDVAPHSGDP